MNDFSRYDVGVADPAFEFEELYIDSFPHLQGIAPDPTGGSTLSAGCWPLSC